MARTPETTLARQIRDLIRKEISSSNRTAPYAAVRGAGRGGVNPNSTPITSAPTSMAPLKQEYGSNKIISGFDLLTDSPPTQYVYIADVAALNQNQCKHSAIINGSMFEATGVIRVDLTPYMGATGESDVFICMSDTGVSLQDMRPINKLEIGRVHLVEGCQRVAKTYDPANPDAYVVSAKDTFYNNNYRWSDSDLAALRNNLDYLFAENIFGNITLSEFLKITSADGTINLSSTDIDIMDAGGNIVAKFNKAGVFFFDSTGGLIAVFGPNENKVSAMKIVNESLLTIPDNNNVDRVKLGQIDSTRDLWGFEMYDARGIPFMSTTQKRQWFRGANITGRLMSIPLYSYVFSAGNSSDYGSYARTQYTYTAGTYDAVGWSCFSGDYVYYFTKDGSTVYFNVQDINSNTLYAQYNLTTLLGASNCYFMQYAGNQKILFSYATSGNSKIGEFDEMTSAFKQIGTTNSSSTPMSLCYADGYIYINYSNNGIIERYSYTSGTATYLNNADTTYDHSISQIVYTGNNIFLAVETTTTRKLFKYANDLSSSSNGNIADFDSKSFIYDGNDLWFGAAGGAVRSYDEDDLSAQATVSSVFSTCYSLAFDGQNVLVFYIGGAGNHRVKKIDIFSWTEAGDMRVGNLYDKDILFDGLNLFIFGSTKVMKMPST